MALILSWYFYPCFSGLAALMSAAIAQSLCSLVCSYLNSYCAFNFFPLSIFFRSVALYSEFSLLTPFSVALYDNGLSTFAMAKWATILVDICCP